MYVCANFGVKELVSPIVYNAWKEGSLMFFDEEILQDLDTIRETYGKPIIINNWAVGGDLKQCGLRSNLDPLVMDKSKARRLYLSAHTMGKAFDLHCGHGQNKKLFEHCYQLLLHKKLKSFKRLEAYELTTGWVHIDSFQTANIIFH